MSSSNLKGRKKNAISEEAVALEGGTKREPADLHVGARLRSLRQRSHLSMRALAEKAGVSVGYVSGVEAGTISPTIATLRKLLLGMGTDIGTFFQERTEVESGPVFLREEMLFVNDGGRNYTLVLPQRQDIEVIILDELFQPHEAKPVMEAFPGDLAGYVIRGQLLLDIEGDESKVLRTGDAFYVKAGRPLRGHTLGEEPTRLITVQSMSKHGKKNR